VPVTWVSFDIYDLSFGSYRYMSRVGMVGNRQEDNLTLLSL
jgi:hypothetical protein